MAKVSGMLNEEREREREDIRARTHSQTSTFLPLVSHTPHCEPRAQKTLSSHMRVASETRPGIWDEMVLNGGWVKVEQKSGGRTRDEERRGGMEMGEGRMAGRGGIYMRGEL